MKNLYKVHTGTPGYNNYYYVVAIDYKEAQDKMEKDYGKSFDINKIKSIKLVNDKRANKHLLQ